MRKLLSVIMLVVCVFAFSTMANAQCPYAKQAAENGKTCTKKSKVVKSDEGVKIIQVADTEKGSTSDKKVCPHSGKTTTDPNAVCPSKAKNAKATMTEAKSPSRTQSVPASKKPALRAIPVAKTGDSPDGK